MTIFMLTVAILIGAAVAVSVINAAVLAFSTPGPQSVLSRMTHQYAPFGWMVLATCAFLAFACFVIAAKGGAM